MSNVRPIMRRADSLRNRLNWQQYFVPRYDLHPIKVETWQFAFWKIMNHGSAGSFCAISQLRCNRDKSIGGWKGVGEQRRHSSQSSVRGGGASFWFFFSQLSKRFITKIALRTATAKHGRGNRCLSEAARMSIYGRRWNQKIHTRAKARGISYLKKPPFDVVEGNFGTISPRESIDLVWNQVVSRKMDSAEASRSFDVDH